jgi:hypothetical protein
MHLQPLCALLGGAGGLALPIYSISFLNPDGGVDDHATVDAIDDDHATGLARLIRHEHAIDVHHGDRHVVRLPPWSRRRGA